MDRDDLNIKVEHKFMITGCIRNANKEFASKRINPYSYIHSLSTISKHLLIVVDEKVSVKT